MTDPIDSVFGPNGLLAKAHAGYETRPQQVKLARAVQAAIQNRQHLIAEGPCGTGKAYAYLVPAIQQAVEAKKRVLVVTHGIGLTEQLTKKDLPALQAIMPAPFTFILLKGRNNYLCNDLLAKEAEITKAEFTHSLNPTEQQQRNDVVAWSKLTKTGDKSELPFDPSAVWDRFSVGEDCKGSSCGHISQCWTQKARHELSDAHAVVTNYHMLFCILQLLDIGVPADALPDLSADVLICDEAHEMADTARDFLGWQLGYGAFKKLGQMTTPELGMQAALAEFKTEAGYVYDRLTAHVRSKAYNVRLRRAGEVDTGQLPEMVETMQARLRAFKCGGNEDLDAERKAGIRKLDKMRSALRQVADPVKAAKAGYIVYLEDNHKGRAKIVCKVLDPAEPIKRMIFKRYPTVVLTSATLSTAGSFTFLRGEVGAPDETVELEVESPFDFVKQSMLLLPGVDMQIPDPTDPDFPRAVAYVIANVARLIGGSTMGLFTSWKSLNAAYDALCHDSAIPFKIFKQGEAPVQQLVASFKATPGSILLGVSSLWTGVDIPGDALRAVIIDKVPFPNPKDPIMDALNERDPRGSFGKVSMPRAIIALRQGAGRLIRAKTDKGLVAILDPRLASKGYGKTIINSLPESTVGNSLDDFAWFMGLAKPEPVKFEEVPF